MNGFLCVNKPLGMTSSDVVVFIRRRLPKGTRVGHGGTLDPQASGVLPVCVGSAARLFDYMIDKEKTYKAVLALGAATDTQDATGNIISESPVNASRGDIERACARFIGDIQQVPPMYSAVKVSGKRLYKLAREGKSVDVAPRKCRVENVSLGEYLGDDRYELTVTCRKGVYIRTICHDIGEALGCGAHMAALERVSAGAFGIESSVSLDEIDRISRNGELEKALLPLDFPIKHIPRVDIDPDCLHAVKNGNPIRNGRYAPAAEGIVRMYINDIFCGIGCVNEMGDCVFKAMLYERAGTDN